MPGGSIAAGPFRSSSLPLSGGSSRRSSSVGGRSVRSSRSAASLGGSSRGSGARAALRSALSATDLRGVAGKFGQEASQKYGSVSKALKSVKTDNRGGVCRNDMRTLCDEYGFAKKDSDRLFDTLAVDGTMDFKDFEILVSENLPSTASVKPGPPIAERSSSSRAPPDPQRTPPDPPEAALSSRSVSRSVSFCDSVPRSASAEPAPRSVAMETTPRAVSARGLPKKMTGSLRFADEHKLPDHILDKVCEDVSHFVHTKYGTLQKAFSDLDARRVQRLDRDDTRRLLVSTGYGDAVADQFLDRVDKENSGIIDFNKFTDLFSPAFGKWTTCKGKSRHTSPWEAKKKELVEKAKESAEQSKKAVPPQPLSEQEVKNIFAEVALTTARKKTTVLKAYKAINGLGKADRSPGINREKIQEYMKLYGYETSTADQVFDYLDKDGSNNIDFPEFQKIFGPYIMPDWNVPVAKSSRRLPTEPAVLTDKSLIQVVKDLGHALSCKYTSAHDCFRTLDTDGSGTLDRDEVREFFGRFAFDEKVADQFFEALDTDGIGYCSRNAFAAHFTPYVVQGFDPDKGKAGEGAGYVEHLDAPRKSDDPVLGEAMEQMGHAVGSRFKTILEAWRHIDENKSGKICRRNVRQFFREHGYNDEMGDRFFDSVNTDGSDDIDYREFQIHFAPHIYGWSQLGDEEKRVARQTQHYETKGKRRRTGRAFCPQAERLEQGAEHFGDDLITPSAKALSESSSVASKKPPSKTGSDKPAYLSPKELDTIFNEVATTTARNSASVSRAFKKISMWGPPTKTQGICRHKFKEYLGLFGYDDWTSDQVFNHIDADGGGSIDYREFQNLFGPHIMPSWVVDDRTVTRELPPAAKPIHDKELRAVIKDVGVAVSQKYPSAFACFRSLDHDNSGTLSKDAVREFFSRFAYPAEIADQFYEVLNHDARGDCDYKEFSSHFTPYIRQGYDGKVENRDHWKIKQKYDEVVVEKGALENCGRLLKPAKVKDPELAEIMEAVETNTQKRFTTIRKLWRTVDLDKDGKIDRGEVRDLFSNMGYESRIADKFFDHVNTDGETIDYREFQKHFAPHIYGWSQLGQEDQLFSNRRAHYEGHESRCKRTGRTLQKALSDKASASSSSTGFSRSEKTRSDAGPTSQCEASSCSSVSKAALNHLTQKEVKRIFKDVATTVGRNTKSIRRAFCAINPARAGGIDKEKLTEYMKCYGYDPSAADQVFKYIDVDGSGSIEYAEFTALFGPYIMPTWSVDPEDRSRDRGIPPPALQVHDKVVRKLVNDLGTAVGKKYKSAHACLRGLDPDNSGTLSKEEVQEFFSRFSYPTEAADSFYATLRQDAEGEISRREFASYFTPFIVQGYDGKTSKDKPREREVEVLLKPVPIEDEELRSAVHGLNGLGSACKSRFTTIRRLWRTTDADKDGVVGRHEIRKFFDDYGYSKEVADKFYCHLQNDAKRHGHDHVDYEEFRAYFAPLIYGHSELGQEDTFLEHRTRASSAPSTSRVGRIPHREYFDERRHHDAAGRGGESIVEAAQNTKTSSRGYAKTPRVADGELNKVVNNMCEKMRAKHGNNTRKAMKCVATNHKDYVTRTDVHKLFRNYGYADVADQFFERLDGDGTGGVDFLSFQRLFSKHIERPEGTLSGQTAYKAAFGA